jgi:molybdopterin-synthase adenylyltransferase
MTNRYRRQMLVKEFSQKGQDILRSTHVVIIGGGGLGSHSSSLLVRMGIGRIDIIDDDTVDLTNLHRTAVFNEKDIGKSKALVLEEKLRSVNTEVTVNGINQKVTKDNIETLVKNADVIMDGTDNLPLRFLINETSMKRNIPWVYAGVYETVGMVMGIIPGKTPCFQCISNELPEPINTETPVLGSLPATIASLQCNETIKLLLDKPLAGLLIYDIWTQCFDKIQIKKNPTCPTCSKKKNKGLMI